MAAQSWIIEHKIIKTVHDEVVDAIIGRRYNIHLELCCNDVSYELPNQHVQPRKYGNVLRVTLIHPSRTKSKFGGMDEWPEEIEFVGKRMDPPVLQCR